MSDPVSNAEIEDVLSSIRRLVSDDPSGSRRRRIEPRPDDGKLVLTPALRVSTPEPEPATDEAPDATDEQPTGGFYEMTLEQRIAQLESAIGQSKGDWEPDGSETEDSDETQPLSARRDGVPDFTAFEIGVEEDEAEEPEAPVDQEPAPESAGPEHVDEDDTDVAGAEDGFGDHAGPVLHAAGDEEPSHADDANETEDGIDAGAAAQAKETAVASDAAAAEEVAGADEAAQTDETADAGDGTAGDDAAEEGESAEPLETGDAGQAAPRRGPLFSAAAPQLLRISQPGNADLDDVAEAAAQAAERVSSASAGRLVWPQPEKDRGAESDATGPDTAEDRTDEPDLDSAYAAFTGQAQDWEDAAEAGTEARAALDTSRAEDLSDTPDDPDAAEALAEADSGEADATLFAEGPEPTEIDEEALRELVSDLVRSELQGVLGERITRNVRRLIRQEIHRALALRELD